MGLRFWLWKRRVRKIAPDQCSICCICDEPIYPGEFVGETSGGRLVHAGYHASLKYGEDAFCETGAIGIGVWNGKTVDRIAPSAASIAMNTGQAVFRTIDPHGNVNDRLIDMPKTTLEEALDRTMGK